MGASTPRRRFAALIGTTLAASLLFGAGTALAAGGTLKIDVCHLDRSTGTYQVITVSSKSAHPKLPKGDFVADARLAGKTIYGLAYTDADSVDGYSACDPLISALVEDSGDSSPSAGDLVLLGSFPTAFATPYGAVAFPVSSADVVSTTCDAQSVIADLGGGLLTVWRNTGIQETAIHGEEDLAPIVYLFDTQGGGSAGEFVDKIIVDVPGTVLTEATADLSNGPWLDVEVPGACPA